MDAAKALIVKLDNGGASDWSGKPEPKYRGKILTAGEVAALEEKLVQAPEDFSARWDLLCYYFQQSNRAAREKHVLWVIEHHPEYLAWLLRLSVVRAFDGWFGV